MSYRLSIRSILIVLPTIVSVSWVIAADDDRVVDRAPETIAPPVRQVVRVHFSPDVRTAQLVAERDQQLLAFLQKVDAGCALTEAQMQKAKLAGQRDVRRFGAQRFSILPDQPSPLFGTDFITTDSLVYKVLMTQLTPEQK